MQFSETSERLSSDSLHITGHMLGQKDKKRKAAETSPETALENGDAHNDAGPKKKKPRHPKSAEKLAAKYGLLVVLSVTHVCSFTVEAHGCHAARSPMCDCRAGKAAGMAGQPQNHTLSIAVSAAAIDNVQSHELATAMAGLIARTAAIFCVDEVVVIDESSSPE